MSAPDFRSLRQSRSCCGCSDGRKQNAEAAGGRRTDFGVGDHKSLGVQENETNFDVGLWTSIVRLSRVQDAKVALIERSVDKMPKLDAEGSHSSSLVHVSPTSPLARMLGRGFEVALRRERFPYRSSEGHVEETGEGTSERFDFRASRAVSSP
ncbi:unnamed protein product [Prunus armeniaca]